MNPVAPNSSRTALARIDGHPLAGRPMTNRQFAEIIVALDQVWDGLDPGREAGYRWVLERLDPELVMLAVERFAHGEGRPESELKWLPKPPEIAAMVHRMERDIESAHRHEAMLARSAARLEALLADQPEPQEDSHA